MKAHQLSQFLAALSSDGHIAQAHVILVDVLRACPSNAGASSRIASLAAALEAPDYPTEEHSPSFADALPLIRFAATLITLVGSKAAIVAGESLLDLAEKHPKKSMMPLLAPAQKLRTKRKSAPQPIPNEAIVAEYVRELLRSAPGLQAFGETLARLRTDTTRVKASEMKLIAKGIGIAVLESDSRPKALKKIERDHQIIEATRAKAEALRGNTSA